MANTKLTPVAAVIDSLWRWWWCDRTHVATEALLFSSLNEAFMLIVVCRHCCAEVQLNFSEFTAERLCLGGTLDSVDIPHKLAYLTHIWYVMCIWPPTSLFRSPTRSGLRQETSLLHTQFFGFFSFVEKPYKKPLNFSKVFVEKFPSPMKVSRSPSMVDRLIAKFRYLMLVKHSKQSHFFSALSQGQQTTAEQLRMWATANRSEMMMVFLGHHSIFTHLSSRANIV